MRSHKARRVNPRKMYAVDKGLLAAMSYRAGEDRGAMLENLVYLHLRRKGLAPGYYFTRSGREVDFILPGEGGDRLRLFQICWSIGDPETRRREVGAIAEAKEELGPGRAVIVTWLDEENLKEGIEVVPAWKWPLRDPGRKEPTAVQTR